MFCQNVYSSYLNPSGCWVSDGCLVFILILWISLLCEESHRELQGKDLVITHLYSLTTWKTCSVCEAPQNYHTSNEHSVISLHIPFENEIEAGNLCWLYHKWTTLRKCTPHIPSFYKSFSCFGVFCPSVSSFSHSTTSALCLDSEFASV